MDSFVRTLFDGDSTGLAVYGKLLVAALLLKGYLLEVLNSRV